ncbi:hypothetical protein DICPUDRAFT_156718 [Dictyostelium purpureum]|uniref:F5/8 type C domain-containing protein n=1 Tax=Dictyostelium purpureum TaxID=5786 RepID=F0ZX89_DICPU|nr:uncharacterized protein DICPUDRAFT_156718 [Dictyostelium purpureum]EGC31439.1 hypothetical protein DICPUDRAFT_156718 [Dictyostelium purpureum]|eukprot:XP_003292038.1 hypothetical protein DICPUDRAFT_156718 [Dictyostelium purpureum]
MSREIPAGSVSCLANALLNLRSSSDLNADHGAKNSVLNFMNSQDKSRFDGSEAWCASTNDPGQFLIAGSLVISEFVAIITQGRGDADQWVTSYKLRYSLDNVTWFDYNNGQVFNGNTDQYSIVVHVFPQPFRARSVSIHPVTYHNHIALRWELYAKPAESNIVQVGRTSIGDGALNSGSGHRETFRHINFDKPFNKIPMVALGTTQIDGSTDNGQLRYRVEAVNVSTTGFDAKFITWGSNILYDVTVNYIAVEK